METDDEEDVTTMEATPSDNIELTTYTFNTGYIPIEQFIANFNTLVPYVLKSEFDSLGLNTDILLLNNPDATKYNDGTLYNYTICDNFINVKIYEATNRIGIVNSITVNVNDKATVSNNTKLIINNNELLKAIVASQFTAICDFRSLDELVDYYTQFDPNDFRDIKYDENDAAFAFGISKNGSPYSIYNDPQHKK